MPLFQYTGTKADGGRAKGQQPAESAAALTESLLAEGITRVTATALVKPHTSFNQWFEEVQGVPIVQKIFFTQNLGVMLRGGFSISRAMGTLALQTNHKYFRRVILELKSDLESGNNLAQSLKKHPRVFPDLFINMISAGEVSGKLDDVLKALTVQMKKDHQLISKVKGAMTYPIVVIIAMIGAGIAMVTFVVPKLADIFSQNGAKLPLPTRVLIGISDLFRLHWLILIICVAGAIVAGVSFGRSKVGQRWIDTLILHAPIAGPIVKKINLARFTRSLSSMLATDIPIIQTFQVIGRTLTSLQYRQSIEESAQALRGGLSIAKVLEKYPKLYPPLVQQMVSVGEESGTLDEVSGELATFYEEEVDQIMSNLSTIIEPVLLLMLGGAVAGMAVAIMLPIYSLTDQVSS